MNITRRGFCLGASAAFAAVATARAGTTTVGSLDPEAIGFISDIHVGLPLARQKYKTMRDYPHQPAASQALVREILALPHPPANVLCLGDISLAFGAHPYIYALLLLLLSRFSCVRLCATP